MIFDVVESQTRDAFEKLVEYKLEKGFVIVNSGILIHGAEKTYWAFLKKLV